MVANSNIWTARFEWHLAWVAYKLVIILPLRFTWGLLSAAGIYAYTDNFSEYRHQRVSFLNCRPDDDEKFDWDGFFDDNEQRNAGDSQ